MGQQHSSISALFESVVPSDLANQWGICGLFHGKFLAAEKAQKDLSFAKPSATDSNYICLSGILVYWVCNCQQNIA